jgi:hypothetical protein
MTWKQHITSAEAKARRKMNIMRKLAGTKWGANEKILKSVYQGNVRPHLEYGSSSWMTAAQITSKVSLPSWILGESVKRVPVVVFFSVNGNGNTPLLGPCDYII